MPIPIMVPAYFNYDVDPLPELDTMTMDEGDVLLCSPAKTGQHWNFEIISMLLKGEAKYLTLGKESSWIDVRLLSDINRQVPQPRVICTHLPLTCVPRSFR